MRHMLQDLLLMLSKEREMRGVMRVTALGLALSLGIVESSVAGDCKADSVRSGTVCIDKYEASVWYVPSTETSLINKIQEGYATHADLTSAKAVAAGVVQLGLTNDLEANGCPHSGNGCVDVYAVSIPGVTPSRFVSWLQAAATARNSRKRLPTNQEWQVAAFGTPESGGADTDDGLTTCNTDNKVPGVGLTGSRSACKSDVGAFDMVGNVREWVADWVPRSTTCGSWEGFSDDHQCFAGAAVTGPPGALMRGGAWGEGTFAGVFLVVGGGTPSQGGFDSLGFRCAR